MHAVSTISGNTLQIYNPANNSWKSGASSSKMRPSSSAVAVGSSIYVIGGYAEAQFTSDIYDSKTDTWSEGPELDALYHSGDALYSNGKLYLVGGGLF